MGDPLRELKQWEAAGQDVLLVLAVERDGPTPGANGAKMLVAGRGRFSGTIGGGRLELYCQERALELLEQKRSGLERLELHPEGAGDLGMICGGEVTVWFQYLPGGRLPEEPGQGSAYLLLEQGQGQSRALLCHREQLPAGVKLRGGMAFTREAGTCRYVERLEPPRQVYVFGAGHVAQALAPGLVALGFGCRVYDDRPDFAVAGNFPPEAQVTLADLEHLEEACGQITGEDFVCVMTHGHSHDYAVVRQVLGTKAAYIGVIGSSKKAAATRERLEGEGFGPADIARLTTPIGLSIGAETPQEIAVSILAQLVEQRASLRNGQ